jgi:hypothetical protein
MTTLSRPELKARLEALNGGLDRFPAALLCPWPLARVFNECLKQAKAEVGDDPVLNGIPSMRQRDPDGEEASGTALVGTVQALTMQVLVALDGAGKGRPAKARASAGSGSSRRRGS